MRSASIVWVSILFLSAFFGCAQNVALVPAPGAERPDLGGSYAAASAAGVEISASGNLWPGSEDIGAVVTPVKLIIRNGSGAPIRIRYDSFKLFDSTGNRYAARSPDRIEESISELVRPYHPARGYYAAPYYPSLYPYFSPFWGDPFFYDPLYYNRYYGYQRKIDLPTPEMREGALAEGVLEDGGQSEGFLYFERIDPDIAQVTFKAELVHAQTEESFAEITIPFTVVER